MIELQLHNSLPRIPETHGYKPRNSTTSHPEASHWTDHTKPRVGRRNLTAPNLRRYKTPLRPARTKYHSRTTQPVENKRPQTSRASRPTSSRRSNKSDSHSSIFNKTSHSLNTLRQRQTKDIEEVEYEEPSLTRLRNASPDSMEEVTLRPENRFEIGEAAHARQYSDE